MIGERTIPCVVLSKEANQELDRECAKVGCRDSGSVVGAIES
jgi:hypothetical protein